MSEKKKPIPKIYVKDGRRHVIVPDENYEGLKSLADFGDVSLMTESEYLGHKEAEAQELADVLRPFTIRRDEARIRLEEGIEEYKEFIMNRNRLNSIVGRPLLPTPWLEPPRTREEETVEDIEYERDEYNEEDYEDIDE